MLFLCILAFVGVRELPGVIYPLLWRCLGVRNMPPASSFYNVHVSNLTGQTLAFTLVLINDRRFEPPSDWLERFHLRTGWRWNRDVVIAAGDSRLIRLPSPVDPRLGMLMVIGRTPLMTDRPLRQGICMRFVTWPWHNGRHEWRQEDGEWPLLACSVNPQDVHWLEGDSADSEGPIVPVLKDILEEQLLIFENKSVSQK